MMTKEIIRTKLKELIGQEVIVYVDRKLGSVHPKYHNIIYPINYGYIKEITAIDGDYQDAYLFGINEPVDQAKGIVFAVVERENDIEDKLIVITNNKEYTLEEIDQLINFQEQYFEHKIVK